MEVDRAKSPRELMKAAADLEVALYNRSCSISLEMRHIEKMIGVFEDHGIHRYTTLDKLVDRWARLRDEYDEVFDQITGYEHKILVDEYSKIFGASWEDKHG